MITQLAIKQDRSYTKYLTDLQISALRSHPDATNIAFIGINYDRLHYFIFMPNFLNDYESFVKKFISSKDTNINDKIRFIGNLTCMKAFFASDRPQLTQNLRYCFDILLYTRFSENSRQSNLKRKQNEVTFDPSGIPFFCTSENELIKAIVLLLTL